MIKTRLHSLFSYHFQNIAAPFIIEACCGLVFFQQKHELFLTWILWTNSLSMPRPHAPVEFSEHRSVMFVCPHSVNGQLTSDIRLYLSERNGENILGRNPLEPQKPTRRDWRHKKSVLFIRKKWSWIARWPTYRDKIRYILNAWMRINRKNIYAEVLKKYVSLYFTINQFCKKYLQHLLERILSLTSRCYFVYRSNKYMLKHLNHMWQYNIVLCLCNVYDMLIDRWVQWRHLPPFSVERTSVQFTFL